MSNVLTLQTPTTMSLSVAPGDTGQFTISLKNAGTAPVPFQFFLNNVLGGWSVYIGGATDYKYTLAPGESRDFIFTVSVPETEHVGTFSTFTVTVDDPI